MKNQLLMLCTSLFMCVSANAEVSFSKGAATKVLNEGLIDCGWRSRISAVGELKSEDGKVWTVPAKNNFNEAPKATDLYNECGNTTLDSLAELKLDKVPVYEAGGGEEFTAYIFADNYFELFVNGSLLAVDAVPFTPFNSSVVRFKAKRPFTVGIKMIDWEETLGLGVEKGRGNPYHSGDGGVVAHIQDSNGKTVAITDSNWKAQTFYIAPIVDRSCLDLSNSKRDSSACTGQSVRKPELTSAAHWEVPENWMKPGFDDSAWPAATTFSNDTVGVNNKRAYTNFVDVFDAKEADAQFIWSSNLVLDNLVLLRTLVK